MRLIILVCTIGGARVARELAQHLDLLAQQLRVVRRARALVHGYVGVRDTCLLYTSDAADE